MLVQYIVLNTSVMKDWPRGAIAAQACHASIAALTIFRSSIDTIQYVSAQNLPNMTTVILDCPCPQSFDQLSQQLSTQYIDHHVWFEKPENLPTAIALRPYLKNSLDLNIRRFKLFK
jgi:peptidyl-tRNA hydrolase